VSVVRQYLIVHTSVKIDLRMLIAFYKHLLALPLGYFKVRKMGDFMARFGENAKIRNFLANTALTLVLDAVLIVGVQPSRAFLADLLCRHIPVVTVDVHNAPARTDAVTADYAQGGYELATHLIQLGHENVLFLCDNLARTGADVAYRGYCAAVQRHGLAPQQARTCRLEPGTGASPAELVASVFDQPDGATAMLAFGLKLAQALYRAAGERSRPIPASLSLAVLAEPTVNLERSNDWTYYQSEAHQLAEWATWLLARAEPGQGPRQVVVPGRVKLGKSTGPARAPGRIPVSPREAVI
jgi:DNA-binding LacI/PurR family transcriptional regulator